ncbi:beta-lactamase class A [Allocatelliglobosispora scoriae]|uniref:Beta-lactamase class A n=1 Tax=Allocatelliglobosispora scoriae TaxID=643052 RepID=A0A841BVV5_9ACTN|nr:serine hydrolase [Allocatelliglobosispora scoriae]MBB5870871.1 beta-lactamase class A [Allocatelliglobosispora scoriae]
MTIDTKSLEQSLQGLVSQHGGNASIAVTDRISGVSISVRGRTAYQSASIIKVTIVAGLMLQRQGSGGTLSAEERELARLAITRSDNDTASRLFALLGGTDGLARAAKKFGMTHTTAVSSWGMTTTTADDQVTLIKAISDPEGLLTRSHQNLLLGWMADVIAGQDFGVPDAAGKNAKAVYVKDGWFDRDDQGGLWQVNTIGRIVEREADWVIACLSDHNATQEAGVAVVSDLVVKAHKLLTTPA